MHVYWRVEHAKKGQRYYKWFIMYSVEITKVHAINEGRFLHEIYLPQNGRRKPATSGTETQEG